MKILAVDTSAMVAAVAVMEDGRLLCEMVQDHGRTHSQKLMPMIKQAMDAIELKPSDLDALAVSSGPGSFTGLRIGVTVVKAMAYAVRKPVIGVPTLDALAYNLPLQERLICPMQDARNDQVYTAVYRWEKGKLNKLTQYMGVGLEEILQLLAGKNEPVVFNGDAALLHETELKKRLGAFCRIAPGHLLLQRASSVAMAAFAQMHDGTMQSCFDLVPYYLRKSQAEREYEARGHSGEEAVAP